jgi:hypothetical protein
MQLGARPRELSIDVGLAQATRTKTENLGQTPCRLVFAQPREDKVAVVPEEDEEAQSEEE